MKGQLSIEFMIVFTGLLIIFATITMPLYNQSRLDAEKVTKIAEAREAANALVGALNTIYASGPGSKLTIEYSLPQGVAAVYLGGYERLDVDGLIATGGRVPINGRADVQILLDFNGDGAWDGNREAVVLVDTILPSRWDENSVELDDSWVDENCVHVEENLKVGFSYGTLTQRTIHRTTLTYNFTPSFVYPRRILIIDEIVGGT
ncbi:MAG: hypothetical protein ABH852_05545 [Methanobacteriota archaeon]